MIERRIVIGLITSTEYLREIRPVIDVRLLKSGMAKRLALWCLEYFDKYRKAPFRDIEGIYFQKLKEGLSKDIAEEIEEDILPDLSEEYEAGINIGYLLDQTRSYFQENHLENHHKQIQGLIAEGKVQEAEQLAGGYKPLVKDLSVGLDLSSEDALNRILRAFAENQQSIVEYPKQLGAFWNHQMVRGGFVAFMSSEKRGKSYLLLDMAVRATRQKKNVVFFQAGDMTESQQLRRLCIHLARRSDLDKYCGRQFEPVRDCVRNQLDSCDKEERECDFGIDGFDRFTEKKLRYEITLDELKDAVQDNPDYKPCFNCEEYKHSRIGAVWLKEVNVKGKLTAKQAQKHIQKFFTGKRRFMLSTHANGTLSIGQMKALLDTWEKQQGFVPDVIIIDYADLLVSETKQDERHRQNEIWKGLRNLSQERHCLVVTATQADANSYEKNRLSLKNFSEDKRKYAHVTAMYGLNQDPQGREKKLKLMRINELVIREGDFNNSNEVWVLQNLSRGLPVMGSFF